MLAEETMCTPDPSRKQQTGAVLNIVAGLLFLAAGFNLLGGGGTIDWLSLVLAGLFLAAGVWGLVR